VQRVQPPGPRLAIAPNAWLFASFDGEFSSRSQSYAGARRVGCRAWPAAVIVGAERCGLRSVQRAALIFPLQVWVSVVVAGVDPAIHPFWKTFFEARWMLGSSPGMTVSLNHLSYALARM
jgi:hypothetical protein